MTAIRRDSAARIVAALCMRTRSRKTDVRNRWAGEFRGGGALWQKIDSGGKKSTTTAEGSATVQEPAGYVSLSVAIWGCYGGQLPSHWRVRLWERYKLRHPSRSVTSCWLPISIPSRNRRSITVLPL